VARESDVFDMIASRMSGTWYPVRQGKSVMREGW
jgi:hypothetical protein